MIKIKRFSANDEWLIKNNFVNFEGDNKDGFECYVHSKLKILKVYRKAGEVTVKFDLEDKNEYTREEVEELVKILESRPSLEL